MARLVLLPRIEVPVLYLGASHDRLVGPRCREAVAARIAGMETVVLDAPHLLLQARPVEAARVIGRFVAAGG